MKNRQAAYAQGKRNYRIEDEMANRMLGHARRRRVKNLATTTVDEKVGQFVEFEQVPILGFGGSKKRTPIGQGPLRGRPDWEPGFGARIGPPHTQGCARAQGFLKRQFGKRLGRIEAHTTNAVAHELPRSKPIENFKPSDLRQNRTRKPQIIRSLAGLKR